MTIVQKLLKPIQDLLTNKNFMQWYNNKTNQ